MYVYDLTKGIENYIISYGKKEKGYIGKMLELKNINKKYTLRHDEDFNVLKNINITFNKGELVSIVGESGSGKSTLMNLMGALDSNFEGELLFNGKDLNKFSQKELDEYRRDKVGFIFQSCNLISHLSVLDNVSINSLTSNVKKEERIKKATELLELVGLGDKINRKPNELSGGQKQRVAIARALMNDPEIILADEPTGALDSQTTEQVLEIIKKISAQGRLVIMVTHSDKVAKSSSRVVRILDGEIIEDIIHEEPAIALDKEANNFENREQKKNNLSFLSSVKLAANNIKQKLGRNILVSAGVSIGIMSIITMLSLGNGLKGYFGDMIDSFINPLVVEVSKVQSDVDMNDPAAVTNAMIGVKPTFEDEDFKELGEIDDVSKVEKGFQYISIGGSNSLTYKNDKKADLMGLSSISSVLTESNVAEGKMPSENEILINKSVEKELGGDIIGKTVTLNAVIDNQSIQGDFVVSGIYTAGENNTMADTNNSVYVNYSDIEKLLDKEGKELKPNVAFLVVEDEDYTSDIKETVKELGYGGSTQELMGEQLITMLDILTISLSGVAAISLAVSSIMTLVTLSIGVVERQKEIGLLKAIGFRRKDIKRIFVSEAFLIGLVSGILGSISAYLISMVVNSLSMESLNIEVIKMTPLYVCAGISISILVSMLAGLLPANKAAKLDPIDSLRAE